MVNSIESLSSKPRRRSCSKAAARSGVSRVKSTIHLSVEASQRLTVHAAMLGMDRSALVEQLIRDGLKRFVVSDRGGPDDASRIEPAEQGRGE